MVDQLMIELAQPRRLRYWVFLALGEVTKNLEPGATLADVVKAP